MKVCPDERDGSYSETSDVGIENIFSFRPGGWIKNVKEPLKLDCSQGDDAV